MKAAKLLTEAAAIAKDARMPEPSYSSPETRMLGKIQDLLNANISSSLEAKAEIEEDTLWITWKTSISRDSLIPGLLEQGNNLPKSLRTVEIASLEKFKIYEEATAGAAVRNEVFEEIKAFVEGFDSVQTATRDSIIRPIQVGAAKRMAELSKPEA